MGWNGPCTDIRARKPVDTAVFDKMGAEARRLGRPLTENERAKILRGEELQPQALPATSLIVELEAAGIPRHAARILGPKIVELTKRIEELEKKQA